MTPEIAKDMIDYLTSRYATDPQVQRWVDNIDIWVVPSVNPDGAMYVFNTGDSWRWNRHPSCPVDLNRNYPALWNSCGGSSASCVEETNHGAAPGSEPETQGMMQLISSVHPLFTLSYHSFGEYIMYPYGCSDPDEWQALNDTALGLNAILENDAGVTGQFRTGPSWSTIYLADGTSIDTQYNLYGAYSFLIEVNASGFRPDYATWRDATVQRQRTAWMYFLDKTLDGPQIRGTVTDAVTGAPLPADVGKQEVVFTHGEAPRHADAKGHYRLLAVVNEIAHVTYSYAGYCPKTQVVSVQTGPATQDAALTRSNPPPGASAAGAGDNAIDVSWPAAAADAVQYRVYRSLIAGGPYALVARVPATQTTYHDTPVSGGATYYYVVRTIQECESVNSPEAHAVTTGSCSLAPTFAGLASVTSPGGATCSLNLSWPAASSRCGGGMTYRVHRSTTSPFVASPANLVASGLAGSSYVDHDGMSNGTPYFYIVRAVDTRSGLDDGNNRFMGASPNGNVLGTWTDDAGDSSPATLVANPPWHVSSTGGNIGPKAYSTGTYPNNSCATLTTPPISLGEQSGLSFNAKYDIEPSHDFGIVEVAPGPAYAAWTPVVVNYPDPLSYAGNACAPTTSGASRVFSRSVASPVYRAYPYFGSLWSYAGQTVKVRWHFSSDAGVQGAGWWIDDISISNAVFPGICAAGATPAPKEAAADGHMTASRAVGGTAVVAEFAPGCGTTDNAIYWGTGPIANSVSWTNAACALGNTGVAAFDPGDPAPGSFLYFVIVGQNAVKEGSYGTDFSGERPEAVGIGACDKPQDLTGSCP